MWYNRFSDFLEKKGLLKNEAPVYTKIRERILYSIDDLNVIGTTKDVKEASSYLKSEFEMKDLDKTKFC